MSSTDDWSTDDEYDEPRSTVDPNSASSAANAPGVGGSERPPKQHQHYFDSHPCPATVPPQLKLAQQFIQIQKSLNRPIVFITVRSN